MRRYANGAPGLNNLDCVPAPKKLKIDGKDVVVNGTDSSKVVPDGEKVLQMRKEHVGCVYTLLIQYFLSLILTC